MIRMIAVTLALLQPGTAAARIDQVLLIGVTDYAPEVTEIAQPLNGPGNDVALLLDVFQDAGVEAHAFTVLTDRPETLSKDWAKKARRPERQEILDALDLLVAGVAPGQRIVVFLAGHGAQVSAPDALEEPDGLDEVFLPADFAIRGRGEFANQITDGEIGTRIDQLVAGGAHVWLIADTCHSGSLRRSDGSDAVPRFLDLSIGGTGQPDAAPLIDVTSNAADAGSFVGFYGAAAGSLAFETRARATGTTHGLLTLALADALRDGEADTFRALAGRVSARLWQIGRGRANPVFAGALAQEQMLAKDGEGADAFAVTVGTRLEISGGLLDGIERGTEIEISASDGAPLFRVEISQSDLTRAFADLPKGASRNLDDRLLGEGLDPERMRFRWLKDRAPGLSAKVKKSVVNFGIGVAIPKQTSKGLRSGVEALAPLVQITSEQPDLTLEPEGDRLYLRPAPAGAAEAMSVRDDRGGHDRLPGILRRTAKTRALLSVAEALRDTPVSRAMTASISIVSGREASQGGCDPTALRRTFQSNAPRPARVGHCDKITLSVTNDGSAAIDITPLYLAPDNQIYFLTDFDGSEKGGWRVSSGMTETLTYTEATRFPDGTLLATGPMHLLLLAVVAKGDGDPVDFRYLQDLSPPARLRSADVTPLAQLLDAAGFGLALTRSIGQHDLGAGGALIIPIETIADERLAEKSD